MGHSKLEVSYQKIEGWHVFTSPDVAGLYVASPDPRKAYDDVASAVRCLFLMNDHKLIKKIKSPFTLREFLRKVEALDDQPNVSAHQIVWPKGSDFRIAA